MALPLLRVRKKTPKSMIKALQELGQLIGLLPNFGPHILSHYGPIQEIPLEPMEDDRETEVISFIMLVQSINFRCWEFNRGQLQLKLCQAYDKLQPRRDVKIMPNFEKLHTKGLLH